MNKYLEKIAEKTPRSTKKEEPLQPHQIRGIDKLMENHGVILSHSTGAGKTRSILEAARRIQKLDGTRKQLIITPASLTTNIDKEQGKHKTPLNMKNIETISFEKALNDLERLSKENYSLIAIDEGHKLRNVDTKRFKGLSELISKADNRLIATATPFYNSPENISPLVNLVSGQKLLPTEKKEFEKEYIKRTVTNPNFVSQFLLGKKPGEKVELTHKHHLKNVLNKYVDSYDVRDDPNSKKNFPTTSEETIQAPMDSGQERMYKYLEGNIPYIIRMKIRHNMPLDKKESAQLNAFSTGVRQVSNSVRPYYKTGGDHQPLSPKIQKAVDELVKSQKSDKNHRGLVYSNYIGAGLIDYSEELTRRGIKHSLYTGALSKKDKDAAVKAYNSGEIPNLLISSSGAEGLDLKGTKLIQALEPHFNKSKIDQVVGRGARFQSHAHLPQGERNVRIQKYQSVFKPGFFGANKSKTIDQYLTENSSSKDEIVTKIKNLMKED